MKLEKLLLVTVIAATGALFAQRHEHRPIHGNQPVILPPKQLPPSTLQPQKPSTLQPQKPMLPSDKPAPNPGKPILPDKPIITPNKPVPAPKPVITPNKPVPAPKPVITPNKPVPTPKPVITPNKPVPTPKPGPQPEDHHHHPGPGPQPDDHHHHPGPGPQPDDHHHHPGPGPQPGPGPHPGPDPHHHPNPPPPPHHPGWHKYPLLRPKDRDFYRNWQTISIGGYYNFGNLSTQYSQMQVELRKGESVKFSLEENITTGFRWFERVDDKDVKVEIEHEGPQDWNRQPYMTGAPGRAVVTIKGKKHGNALVELIYARPWEWEKDEEPWKVIEIFVHVSH